MKRILLSVILLSATHTIHGLNHAIVVDTFDDLDAQKIKEYHWETKNLVQVGKYNALEYKAPSFLSSFGGCDGLNLSRFSEDGEESRAEAVRVRAHSPEDYAKHLARQNLTDEQAETMREGGLEQTPGVVDRLRLMALNGYFQWDYPEFRKNERSKRMEELMQMLFVRYDYREKDRFIDEAFADDIGDLRVPHYLSEDERKKSEETVYTRVKSEDTMAFERRDGGRGLTARFEHEECTQEVTPYWLGLYEAVVKTYKKYSTRVSYWQTKKGLSHGFVIIEGHNPAKTRVTRSEGRITSRGKKACFVAATACLAGIAAWYTWFKR